MNVLPWQLQIVKRSLKKREKVKIIERDINVSPRSVALDLGCAQGILSYFLRKKGGFWASADQDMTNLKTTQGLIGTNLVQVAPVSLPFKNNAFDLVAALDYLEHVDNDRALLAELHRVLKPGAEMVAAVPHTGAFFLLQKLRPVVGLKLEFYGHKREGYGLRELKAKLERAGFRLIRHKTYAKFFSELFELVLNAGYVNILAPRSHAPEALRDGRIRPSTEAEFFSKQKAFRLYTLIYPLVWLAAQFDRLLFFQRGYSLVVWARKL